MKELFRFSWSEQHKLYSFNDVVRHWLLANGYNWGYDHYGRLETKISDSRYYFEHRKQGDVGIVYLIPCNNSEA